MSPGRRIAVLVLPLAMAAAAAGMDLPRGSGLLLPVQDRVGDPHTARQLTEGLGEALGDRLADSSALRETQRRLRLRDLDAASPSELDRLADELGASWLLSTTLHHAVAEPVPQVTLSARLYERGADELGWVRLESMSGIDDLRWLGMGAIEGLEELTARTVARLAPAGPPAGESSRAAFGPSRTGFVSRPMEVGELGRVAVVPFDGVSEGRPELAAEAVTVAALAELRRRGARVLVPGLVYEIQRHVGRLLRGEVDVETRESLHAKGGVDSIVTGTVEVFETGGGLEPDPRVAFSIRLIDARNGRILWMDGADRTGLDAQRLFRIGRIHSEGQLLGELMQSLMAGLLGPGGRAR